MNMVTVLHKKAMEFADEALLARMEGNEKAATLLFEKALSLEKEAVFTVPNSSQDKDSYFILLRSAASLAFNCGRYREARKLINMGLESGAPTFIYKELRELEARLSEANTQPLHKLEMVGTITHANANKSEIRLRDSRSKEYYRIVVPNHLIDEIVKSYWAAEVKIAAQRDASGTIILEKISKAA
ncbi:MAG: hypothetical protein AAF798_18950 [Bacteroidota bacterium]